jgi:hypothetical protein
MAIKNNIRNIEMTNENNIGSIEMTNEKFEFNGPIFMAKESKFEDVNEVLPNHNITNSYDDWLKFNTKMVEIYNDTNHWHTACNIEEQELQKFITENNISSFMVQPVAIYNGQTLTARSRRLSDLSDPIFASLRKDGTEIVLYQLYCCDPSSHKKYLVRYAMYNGVGV